jgi:hypothetical protein
MIRIVDSIEARYLHIKAEHFNLFPEGKRLRRLHGIHNGERCFIIGNGPSLKPNDLSILDANREITFAFNRIYHIFPETSWRPTYYVSQDDKMLLGCQSEVCKIPALIKFIPAEFQWYYGIDVEDALIFHLKNRPDPDRPIFSDRIDKCIINSNTVVITAIQIAMYMGIKDIYLIGVDHHFHTSINSRGEIIVDSTAKDYFSEEYNKDKHNLYIPNVEKSTLDFYAIKSFAQKRGVRIINSTRGGELDVFTRLSFDLLF